MVEDDDGNPKGVALITPEGFRQFLRDKDIVRVPLVIAEDKTSGRLCRAPLDPLCVPYFTMRYSSCFLSFHEHK